MDSKCFQFALSEESFPCLKYINLIAERMYNILQEFILKLEKTWNIICLEALDAGN